MKKTSLFICAGLFAAILSMGSANAAPGHHGGHHHHSHPMTHSVVHVVHPAPAPVHVSHHHHHHHDHVGDIIVATAVLISALM